MNLRSGRDVLGLRMLDWAATFLLSGFCFEVAVKLIQGFQAFFDGTFRGPQAKPGLGIVLNQGDSGEFIDQFVHADALGCGQLPEARVFFLGHSNG